MMKKKLRLMQISSVTLPAALLLSTASFAADDLESLKLTITKQEQMLQELSQKVSALSIPKQSKYQTKISGQISAVGFNVDDGLHHRTYLGTNDNSNTRFKVSTNRDISSGLSIGSELELGFKLNQSDSISQDNSSSSNIEIRHAELFIDSSTWGKIWFGKGKTAAQVVYADLSGTTIASRASVDSIGGGMYFNGDSSNPQVSDIFDPMDAFGKKFRLRYDTPSYHGFSLAGSLLEGSKSDVAIRYSSKLSGAKLKAEVGYTSSKEISSGSNLAYGHELATSLSVLLPSGFSLSATHAEVDAKQANRKKPSYYYIKPGYQFKYFAPGLTALSADIGRYSNIEQSDDTGRTLGVQVVQYIDSCDMQVYAGYRKFKLDRPSSNALEDMNIYFMGALYKF